MESEKRKSRIWIILLIAMVMLPVAYEYARKEKSEPVVIAPPPAVEVSVLEPAIVVEKPVVKAIPKEPEIRILIIDPPMLETDTEYQHNGVVLVFDKTLIE